MWSRKWLLMCLYSVSLASAKQPNILFILTDDQDKHMRSSDHMPHLQEHIVAKGVTFEHHFCTVALCCPSRANLWTGRMAHNTNVTDVSPPYGGYGQVVKGGWNDNYLPLWMQEAGYNTYYTGKLWNYHSVDNYNAPYARGFNGSDFLLDPYTYLYHGARMTRNGARPVSYEGQYSPDVIADKALGFLDEALSHDRPWMLTVAPIAPHSNGSFDVASRRNEVSPPAYAERHAHMFRDFKIPRDGMFNTPISGGPSWIGRLRGLNESEIEYNDEYQRCRLRALQSVDEMLLALVKTLEKAGVMDNTYIFYSTDNGYHISQHAMKPGKDCGYDTDTNIPLFIRGPGLGQDVTSYEVSSHTDLAPTFLTLAGVHHQKGLDGQVLPYFGPATTNPSMEHVGLEFWGLALAEGKYGYGSGDGEGRFSNTHRNNTYKALRILGDGYSLYYSVWCTNEKEYYDLHLDPAQVKNMAASISDHSSYRLLGRPLSHVMDRLDALMMVLKSCKEEACRSPWKKLHPHGQVRSLAGALDPSHDNFYAEQPKVSFSACEMGYLLDSEGPQHFNVEGVWNPVRKQTFQYGDQWTFYT